MSSLQLTHLRKAYNPAVVPVKDISLTVEAGEFLTLLGPSGCGKSTILRLIAGLEAPTSGEIVIGGRNVTGVSPGDRNIAMVFQSYALYPHMTVYNNIASGLKLRNIPEAQIRQRIANVSEFLGLGELMDRKPGKLSGGQRQRVAVARALVREPDIFLLDEPLSNLDALLREQVRAELKQLFSSQNVPVVYVTHDQTEAMTLSTRVAVLNGGELQQLDTPQNIYSHPANRFVAGFIGSPQMNFLTLPCEGEDALLGNTALPLPTNLSSQSLSKVDILMGIRPEEVKLADALEVQGKGYPTVQGEVFLVENLGMSMLVSVRLPGRLSERLAGRSSGRSPGSTGPVLRGLLPVTRNYAQGERLALVLPPQALHWFELETGRAIG